MSEESDLRHKNVIAFMEAKPGCDKQLLLFGEPVGEDWSKKALINAVHHAMEAADMWQRKYMDAMRLF